MTICEICSEEIKYTVVFCNNEKCSEKIQCFCCVKNFEKKCCFCSEFINIYNIVLIHDNEFLLKEIIEFLTEKLLFISKNYFSEINILNKLLNMWILNEISNIPASDILTMNNLVSDISLYKIQKEKFKFLKSLKFLKRFTKTVTLDELQDIKILNNKTKNCHITEYFFSEEDKITNIKFIKEDDLNRHYISNNFKIKSPTKNYEKYFYMFLKYFSFPFFDCEKESCTCNLISCDSCNKIYCKFCLSNSCFGLCKEKELNNSEFISDIKLCPNCKILTIKDVGCDDMWCLNCKTFFSWKYGITRLDKPHNPDYMDFIIKNNVDNLTIKNLIVQDLIEEFNSDLGLEDSLIIDCQYNEVFSENKIEQMTKEYILPSLIRQSLVLNIINKDPIFNRNFKDFESLFRLIDNYKNIIKKLCGELSYKMFWYVIEYENIKINTKNYKIIYKNLELDTLENATN